MTQSIINIGTAPNDGTGDPTRSAFDKCNLNFTELYLGVAKGVSIGSAIEYQFNNTTTEPPASGQIRFNQATQASTTKLWASHTTSSGINIKQFLSAATTGAKLILQDENDNTNYIKFDVTGVPVDKTTYWEFAVAVTASGGNLPNAAILAAVTAAAGGGGTSTVTPPQGRLTLQTGTPVMTTTQSAKTTIYYTPYIGDKIPLYDGTNMVPTTFTELSVATTDTTKSPAAIGASKINDWFIWSDAGTIRIGHGPDWTSDTARAAGTALVMVNGILLNNASITNGPAASRGTYVGTTRSNASSQIDWIFGAAASGGSAAILGVWNCYNRVTVATEVRDNGVTYTYSSATVRQARASAGNQISFVLGLQEDAVTAFFMTQCSSAAVAAAAGYWGVGLDSTSSFTAPPNRVFTPTGAVAQVIASPNHAIYFPGIGRHVISANEGSDGSNGNGFCNQNAQTLNAVLRM